MSVFPGEHAPHTAVQMMRLSNHRDEEDIIQHMKVEDLQHPVVFLTADGKPKSGFYECDDVYRWWKRQYRENRVVRIPATNEVITDPFRIDSVRWLDNPDKINVAMTEEKLEYLRRHFFNTPAGGLARPAHPPPNVAGGQLVQYVAPQQQQWQWQQRQLMFDPRSGKFFYILRPLIMPPHPDVNMQPGMVIPPQMTPVNLPSRRPDVVQSRGPPVLLQPAPPRQNNPHTDEDDPDLQRAIRESQESFERWLDRHQADASSRSQRPRVSFAESAQTPSPPVIQQPSAWDRLRGPEYQAQMAKQAAALANFQQQRAQSQQPPPAAPPNNSAQPQPAQNGASSVGDYAAQVAEYRAKMGAQYAGRGPPRQSASYDEHICFYP